MFNLVYAPMAEIPAHWKPRLRELSYGPDEGTTYRATYQDGSCYASVLRYEKRIIAWACLTFEDAEYPVIGCFVDPTQRKKGLGRAVSEHLLDMIDLPPGTLVYAYRRLWKQWPTILADAKLVYVEWESD